MDEKIIENCCNCKNKVLSFCKKKNPQMCDLYLYKCYECPFEHEYMILSGNDNFSLPLELKNVYQVIELIKKGKVYLVEVTGTKVNVFFDNSNMKFENSEKYLMIFNFIKGLKHSDKLKPFIEKLKKEASEDFMQILTDKRKAI